MKRSISRLFVALAVAATSLLGAGASIAAAAPALDLGDHGAQAQCRYVSRDLEGWSGAMRLKRMTVMPPTLYSIDQPGRVGWRMIVQRRYDFASWKRIFSSTISKADATPSTAAAFSAKSALINSPLFVKRNGEFVGVDYRVILRFYWYESDGSIARSERHRVRYYDTLRDGQFMWTDGGACHHGWIFP